MHARAVTIVLVLAGCGSPDAIRRPPDDLRPNRHRPVAIPPEDAMLGPAAGSGPFDEPALPTPPTVPPVPAPPTVFEYAPFPIRPAPGVTGPVAYTPTAAEEPFTWRIAGPVVTQMNDPVGTFVAWFGIVRGIESVPGRDRTRLWIEGKYFHGSTDASVLGVDFNGGGDFVATLQGARHKVIPLSLVHVYGTITSREGDVPRVAAEYVREWD